LCSTHCLHDPKAEHKAALEYAQAEAQAASGAHTSSSSSSAAASSAAATTVNTQREKSETAANQDTRCKTMPEQYQDIGIVDSVLPYLGKTIVFQGGGKDLLHDRYIHNIVKRSTFAAACCSELL
jgi:hypothetical protein